MIEYVSLKDNFHTVPGFLVLAVAFFAAVGIIKVGKCISFTHTAILSDFASLYPTNLSHLFVVLVYSIFMFFSPKYSGQW